MNYFNYSARIYYIFGPDRHHCCQGNRLEFVVNNGSTKMLDASRCRSIGLNKIRSDSYRSCKRLVCVHKTFVTFPSLQITEQSTFLQRPQKLNCTNGNLLNSSHNYSATRNSLDYIQPQHRYNNFRSFSGNEYFLMATELKLITRPATTTTPTPYVHTTAKPRRKQHQNHSHKSAHDTINRIKDTVLPNNLKENEIIGPGMIGLNDGSYTISILCNFISPSCAKCCLILVLARTKFENGQYTANKLLNEYCFNRM